MNPEWPLWKDIYLMHELKRLRYQENPEYQNYPWSSQEMWIFITRKINLKGGPPELAVEDVKQRVRDYRDIYVVSEGNLAAMIESKMLQQLVYHVFKCKETHVGEGSSSHGVICGGSHDLISLCNKFWNAIDKLRSDGHLTSEEAFRAVDYITNKKLMLVTFLQMSEEDKIGFLKSIMSNKP